MAEIYAENRTPEHWIEELASRSVFVHTDPARWRYWLEIAAMVLERFHASR